MPPSCRRQGFRRRHAYRQPDHRPRSVRNAFALLADFVRELRSDGHVIGHVDLGGGLGIPYRNDNEPPPLPDAYAAVVKRATRDLGCRLIFEPAG